MMGQKIVLIICLFMNVFFKTIAPSIDPFSKINITSDFATCKMIQDSDTNKKSSLKQFVFQYEKNVNVVFADQSTITAGCLNIVFENTKIQKKDAFLEHFKKVTFTDNVQITNAQHKAVADKIEIILPKKLCVLEGNVIIQQLKTKKTDIPIIIKSERAELNLVDGCISLIGNADCPVSTTISLEGHSTISYKKDIDKKKHKKYVKN